MNLTRSEVLSLAKAAGIPFSKYGEIGCQECATDLDDELDEFARLVAEHVTRAAPKAEPPTTSDVLNRADLVVAPEAEPVAAKYASAVRTLQEIASLPEDVPLCEAVWAAENGLIQLGEPVEPEGM